MTGLPWALEDALAEVRRRGPQYQDWWRGGPSAAEPPWSDRDEAALAWLAPSDPGRLRATAEELERVRDQVLEAATTLAGLAAIDGPPAEACARLAARARERAGELAVLAGALRDTAERTAGALELVARRVLGRGASPGGPVASGEDWQARHGELLRGLRAGLADATATWCPGDTGCPSAPGSWLAGEPSPPVLPAHPGGTGVRLPDTLARRPGPGTGVRVAWFPDLWTGI